jgi:hypothetical protein
MTAARLSALAIAVVLAATGCSGAVTPGPTGASSSPGASPVEDATLVFSDQISGDIEGPLPPLELAIYADGRVLWPTWSDDGAFVFLEARLSSIGLSRVRALLEASGFFDAAVEIAPAGTMDPEHASGFSGYALALRTDAGLVSARTTNLLPSAEGHRLIELAERWRDPIAAVPTGSWDRDAAGPVPFEPTHWHLQTYPSARREEPLPDVAEVSAAIGDPRTFGAPLGPSADMGRCGDIDAAHAAALIAFLRLRLGASVTGHEFSASLAWRDGSGSVDLYLRAALPHEVGHCP